jgi:hypothetical protein
MEAGSQVRRKLRHDGQSGPVRRKLRRDEKGSQAGRKLWQGSQSSSKPCPSSPSSRSLWRGREGSLTVEALLILPIILVLMALFLRWGVILRDDLDKAARRGEAEAAQNRNIIDDIVADIGFLYGSRPARRIRDADFIVDLGHSIKENLPKWTQKEGDK